MVGEGDSNWTPYIALKVTRDLLAGAAELVPVHGAEQLELHEGRVYIASRLSDTQLFDPAQLQDGGPRDFLHGSPHPTQQRCLN